MLSLVLYLVIFFLILWCGISLFKRPKHPLALKAIFKDFKRKIIMTLSLGAVFTSIYIFFVWLSMKTVDALGTKIFFFAFKHPVELIYSGLFLFTCLSLSIYFVRMLVKYFYLTKGKDY